MISVVELLQSLVRIPSVNPDGNPGVSPHGEKKVALAIQDFLAPFGFDIVLEDVEPDRPNLVARAPGPENRPRIMLAPHLDTVGIDGMTIDPFAASVSEGKIHGRGTSDTKGSMAAMLWGLARNSDRLDSLPVAVDFVAFMGEESSQPGSRHFSSIHADEYDFAIAGEPTSLKAVHCTKGSLWVTLQASGKSTHASQPHLGENAILKLLEEIGNSNTALSRNSLMLVNPILGSSTMNVGTITEERSISCRTAVARSISDRSGIRQDRTARKIIADFVGSLEIVGQRIASHVAISRSPLAQASRRACPRSRTHRSTLVL